MDLTNQPLINRITNISIHKDKIIKKADDDMERIIQIEHIKDYWTECDSDAVTKHTLTLLSFLYFLV
jgi:hypothetical protein